jgi:hypothetical protein
LSFKKSHRKKLSGESDLEIVEARKWTPIGPSTTQATAYSRMLSPYMVVWWCSVMLKNNIWFALEELGH